jgi:hypothetical protein
VVWIFSGMYVLSALLTFFLKVSPEAKAYAEKHGDDGVVALGH